MPRVILQLGSGAQPNDVRASVLNLQGVTDAVEASQANAVIASVDDLTTQKRRELANQPGVEGVFDDLQGLPLVADQEEVQDFLERVRQRRGAENAPLPIETEPTRPGDPIPDGGAITLPTPQGDVGPTPTAEGPIDSARASVKYAGAHALHEQGVTGKSVIAVVVDTGSCGDSFREDRQMEGTDLTGEGDPWTHLSGHGGMTMGIMAGDERTPGIERGFLPEADLYPIKSTLAATELMQAQDIIASLAEENPDKTIVVNNSWGFPECAGICRHPVTGAIQNAARQNRVIQVFAAGNEGGEDPTACGADCSGSTPGISGPNSVNEVITVAASGKNGKPTEIQPYSSRGGPGKVSCGDEKPDVTAPTFGEMPFGCESRNMGNNGGTSAACPQVAGTVGLIADAKARITTTTVTAGLEETAQPIPPDGDTFDGCSGAGNIQADKAADVTAEGGGSGDGPTLPRSRGGDTIKVVGVGAGLGAVAALAREVLR